MTTPQRIAVLGGGAWGTALAHAAALAGRDVVLWLRDEEQADQVQRTRVNARHLPGLALHERVEATADPAALAEADATLAAVPAQALRACLSRLRDRLPPAPLILCAKGIEAGTGRYLSEVAADLCPGRPIAVLSGPSFAADVAAGLPTAVTVACGDGAVASAIAGALSGPSFRLYHTEDVRGVEIGGAAKNVLAIAAGIAEGRRLGDSAKAALVARGFAEMMRFATACGGRAETLMGLSGLGDVMLSCSSPRSRNFAFGMRVGRGDDAGSAEAGTLIEGAATAPVLVALAEERGIDMPVAGAVADVLAGRSDVETAIAVLMSRPLKREL